MVTEAEGRGQPVELPDIPFNVAAVEGRELEYIQQAIQGGHPASGGEFTRRTADLLAEHTGPPRC